MMYRRFPVWKSSRCDKGARENLHQKIFEMSNLEKMRHERISGRIFSKRHCPLRQYVVYLLLKKTRFSKESD
jgi:hypothetical protein